MRYYLTGMKFGRLTAIRMVGKTASQAVIWECKCDCGAMTQATASSLVKGHKKSCGCMHTNMATKNLMTGGYWNERK